MASNTPKLFPNFSLQYLKQKIEEISKISPNSKRKSWVNFQVFFRRKPKFYHLFLYLIILILLFVLYWSHSTRNLINNTNNIENDSEKHGNDKTPETVNKQSPNMEIRDKNIKFHRRQKFSSSANHEEDHIRRTNERVARRDGPMGGVVNPHNFQLVINSPMLCKNGNKVIRYL